MTAITVNLEPKLVDEVKVFSTKNSITQKGVFEVALKKFFEEYKKKEIEQQVKEYATYLSKNKKARDEEISLAESGMDDYLSNIKKEDNESS